MSINWETTSRARARLAVEKGHVVKDWGGRLPIALVYPNTYYVGMSSLGFQIVYRLLNERADVVCERAFYEAAGKGPIPEGVVLSLETQRPLGDFAALAFSLSFELDYFHVVATLREAGLPVWAGERDERHPYVVGGGPALTANPEPVAPFFDAIVVGEAEPALPAVVEALSGGLDRPATLRQLAKIPGVYVPALYRPRHAPDGRLTGFDVEGDAPPVVARVWQRHLSDSPGCSAILTSETELSDMFLVEVSRGCARGCLFCLAGYCFLPVRERDPDEVLALARQGMAMTKRIGLVGAAVSDYRHLERVVTRLREEGAEIGVSSLRVDSLTEPVARALVESGSRTVTLGLEAGSQRLRDLIHKGIGEDQILAAVDLAGRVGFRQIKLYYMIGLPGEQDEDVRALVDITWAVAERLERARRGAKVIVTLTPFVPKAQTPFQWVAMRETAELAERQKRALRALRSPRIEARADSVEWARIEGLLARGDRRLAVALASLDRQSLAAWHRALKRQGLEADFYLRRQLEIETVLPWAVVSSGVRPETLARLGAGAGDDES